MGTKFVKSGPKIPDKLLRAHEDGEVVFFCGAGISCQAGLPLFDKLVEKIYENLGEKRDTIEEKAFISGYYDRVLNLFENRIGKENVRNALQEILKPKYQKKNAKATHEALLDLSKNREGEVRLVTTNFDLIFEKILKERREEINKYVAPLLPVPKNSRWNGLVYLHGRFPISSRDNSSINNLVLTSSDFGLAYLIERWAARFVSELFKRYVVCFVGYSINDPVLRYMMDALAADRKDGEKINDAYILACSESNNFEEDERDWSSRGAIPIIYRNNHEVLHQTIREWAGIYRDGINGKCSIIVKNTNAKPDDSTKEDIYKEQVLWALSDTTAIPARYFSNIDPCPRIEWLNVFSEKSYKYKGIFKGFVNINDAFDCDNDNTKYDKSGNLFDFFSIFSPIDDPYTVKPVSLRAQEGSLDKRLYYIAKWMFKYLNNPELFFWIIERGGKLHSELIILLKKNLKNYVGVKKRI